MTVLIVVWIAGFVVVMAYGYRVASKADADDTPANDLELRRRYNASQNGEQKGGR